MQANTSLVFAVALALVLTVLFIAFRSRGPWGAIWTVFLFLFLAMWASELYVMPLGPVRWGVAWVPIIFSGVLLTILLIALTPDVGTRRRMKDGRLRNVMREVDPNYHPEDDSRIITTSSGIGVFFWVIVVVFILVVIVGLT